MGPTAFVEIVVQHSFRVCLKKWCEGLAALGRPCSSHQEFIREIIPNDFIIKEDHVQNGRSLTKD